MQEDYITNCESRLAVLSSEIEDFQKKINIGDPDKFKNLIQLNNYHLEYNLLFDLLTKANRNLNNAKKIENTIDVKRLCDEFDQIMSKWERDSQLELESQKKEEKKEEVGNNKKRINKKGNQYKDEQNIQEVIDQLTRIKKEMEDQRKAKDQEIAEKNTEIDHLNRTAANQVHEIKTKETSITQLRKELDAKKFEIKQLNDAVQKHKGQIKYLYDSMLTLNAQFEKNFMNYKKNATQKVVNMTIKLDTLQKEFISIRELYIKRELMFNIFEELFHLPQTRLEFPNFLGGWELQVDKLIDDPKLKVQDEGRLFERKGDMEIENEKNCFGEEKESKLRINKLKPPLPSTIYVDNKSVWLNDREQKNKKLTINANIFQRKEVTENYSYHLNVPNPYNYFKRISEENVLKNIRAFNSSNNQILIVIQTFMLVLTDLNKSFSNSNYEEELSMWNELVEILVNVNKNNQRMNEKFSDWKKYEVSNVFNQMANDIEQVTHLYYKFCGIEKMKNKAILCLSPYENELIL